LSSNRWKDRLCSKNSSKGWWHHAPVMAAESVESVRGDGTSGGGYRVSQGWWWHHAPVVAAESVESVRGDGTSGGG
jgi:hypothetical protein